MPGATPRARFRILGLVLAVVAISAAAFLVAGLPAGRPWDRWALVCAVLACVAVGLFLNRFGCPRCGAYYLWQRYPMHVEQHWMPDRCRKCGLPSDTPYAEVTRLPAERIAELPGGPSPATAGPARESSGHDADSVDRR